MISKRTIDEAIENGRRNHDTMRLIANWCSNAQVESMGYGMLAQQTGLPIGHHGLRCDFATDGGSSYCYELSDAAIDFYDRNCDGCTHRKGGSLPNIMELIGARNRDRERRNAEARKQEEAAERALAERQEARKALRLELPPVAQALLDDVDAYDRDSSQENLDRLRHSARLAPEHFPAPLVDYIFSVLESGHWLDTPGLEMLDAIGADAPRLAGAAARIIAIGGYTDLAARVLIPRVHHIGTELITNATPAAIDRANPDPRHMIGLSDHVGHPELLCALYGQDRAAVDVAIDRLLDQRRAASVDLAGRGLSVLLQDFPDAATPHRQTLIATFVRAQIMIPDFEELTNDLHGVADAVVGAFDAEPEATDKVIQQYLEGATDAVRARVAELYGRALRARFNEALPSNSERVRIAFRRLLWMSTEPFNSDVLMAAISTFRDGRDELVEVAIEEIEGVLAAPFLLADRLRQLEETPLDPANPLATMERANHRSSLTEVMRGLLRLAAHATAQDRDLLPRLATFLDAIPEDRQVLRGLALKEFAALASDVDGFAFYLPHLYHSLVGPSTVERAYAADAIGELRQATLDNAPDLLFESFVPLLSDSYVMVHKAAARAFRRSAIPERLRRPALSAIYHLIRYYRMESGEDNFLADCVDVLAGSVDEFGKQSGGLRRYLIEVCMDIDPMYLRSHLRGFNHTLGSEPSFAKLVIRVLPSLIDRFNRNDKAERLVRGLSNGAILQYQADFEALGREMAKNEQWLTIVIIDALARAGAAEAAARVAAARVNALEDVPRNRDIRNFGRQIALAFAFEEAVGTGDRAALERLAGEWKELARERDQHREDRRERNSRSRLPFSR